MSYKNQSDSNHLSKVIEKAEAGDKIFQSCLGTMYYKGDGVSIDYEKAFYWIKKAAAQEHINAMYNLGYMYWSGEGTLEDYEKAFYWFSTAAEQRFAPAQNYLGMMYRDGRGVDEDFEEAFIWFSIAAEQGNSEAQCNLALMYIEGGVYCDMDIICANEEKLKNLLNNDIEDENSYVVNLASNEYFKSI